MHFKFYLPFLRRGFVKDVIHSNHLGKNGAIAERVAQCSQPGSEIAQYSHSMWISGGGGKKVDIHIQDDGPTPYQVVQVRTAHTYQSGGRKNIRCIFTVHSIWTVTRQGITAQCKQEIVLHSSCIFTA